MRLGEQWKIELVCTDFESLSYHVGHHRGLPVISIDNQHALTRARLHYPKQHRGEALTAKLVTRLMILHASEYLITAFFPAQLRRKDGSVVSPILRKEVLTAGDREGGYALVYVTSPCRRAGGLNEAHPAVFRVLRIRPPGQGRENAYYVDKMGYGTYWDKLTKERIESFLFNLDLYREYFERYPR